MPACRRHRLKSWLRRLILTAFLDVIAAGLFYRLGRVQSVARAGQCDNQGPRFDRDQGRKGHERNRQAALKLTPPVERKVFKGALDVTLVADVQSRVCCPPSAPRRVLARSLAFFRASLFIGRFGCSPGNGKSSLALGTRPHDKRQLTIVFRSPSRPGNKKKEQNFTPCHVTARAGSCLRPGTILTGSPPGAQNNDR